MIIHSEYSIFGIAEKENIDILVNPANTVGVMGAGLALEFKLRYPQYYEDYRKQAIKNQYNIGQLYIYQQADTHIATVFTKKHWKYPSTIEWVKAGLAALDQYLKEKGPMSVAMPLLGTGKGGLERQRVIKEIENMMKNQKSTIYICHDRCASNQETTAIKQICQMPWETIQKHPLKQTLLIIREHPKSSRFRDLQKIKGLGKITYQKLFLEFMCSNEKNKNIVNTSEQRTLF